MNARRLVTITGLNQTLKFVLSISFDMLRSLFNSFVVPRLGNYCFLLWIHGYGVVIRFGFKSDDDYSELIRESQFWSCDFLVRDNRNNRVSLFDGIEEGGIRAQSVYSSSHEIDEHDNEQALDGLQDRVNLLKRLSGDINEEVDSHNRMLDRMGNDMDSSRGVLSGTMDKFKMVLNKTGTECKD
ncbi:hypothetical protein ACSQ67_024557 [Phaseolus vulgaris]